MQYAIFLILIYNHSEIVVPLASYVDLIHSIFLPYHAILNICSRNAIIHAYTFATPPTNHIKAYVCTSAPVIEVECTYQYFNAYHITHRKLNHAFGSRILRSRIHCLSVILNIAGNIFVDVVKLMILPAFSLIPIDLPSYFEKVAHFFALLGFKRISVCFAIRLNGYLFCLWQRWVFDKIVLLQHSVFPNSFLPIWSSRRTDDDCLSSHKSFVFSSFVIDRACYWGCNS